MQISEDREKPWQAKEVRLQCPHCLGFCHVLLPWKPTAAQRQQAITKVVDEHRKVCTAAPSDEARVYAINYPRA